MVACLALWQYCPESVSLAAMAVQVPHHMVCPINNCI